DPPKVKDDANLFSPKTIEEANALIAEIEHKFKKEVHVEAYNKPPADKMADFNEHKRDANYRQRFFTHWAEERYRATGTNGIFVLLNGKSKQGYYVKAKPGPETKKRVFTAEDCRDMEEVILEKFKAGEDNDGLVDGLKFARHSLEANERKVKQPEEARP